MQLDKLIQKYESKQPEIVFEWKDSETEAEGWIVINSLRGGAAGGGTRMRKGLNKHEVTSLAKTMEIKFAIAGPAIGGAKSGINFDPADPRKKGVLERWYKAVMPLLKAYYGTGGDLNVDEIHEVIPITEKLGLFHPQEGVVNGHFKVNAISTKKRLANLTGGVSKKLTDLRFIPADDKNLVTADMITGYGVAEAVRHYYGIWGGNVNMKRAIIQGWGNVGAAAAYYLSLYGVMIVGIIDRNGGLIKNTGFTKDEIKELFLNKQGNTLVHPDMLSYEEVNAKIWDIGAEIFVPAAASRLLTKEQVDRMVEGELEVISCGANVPFADEEIFMGAVANYTDDQVAVIPDFIANCGMARVFAYLMSNDLDTIEDAAIFEDTSDIIKKALQATFTKNKAKTGIAKAALEIALQQLV